MTTPTPWPQGKTFAFSVIDDTDNATLRSVRPFYDALRHYGLRTTKTVWSLPPAPGNRFTGESLADEAYRAWIQSLAADGFEIGWHGARSGATPRELTIQAHEVFRETLGHWPETYANHAQNADCIYWGRERFDAAEVRAAYGIFRAGPTRFGGSTPASPFYWGDLCYNRIRYVRGFTFSDIVTTRVDPFMPFADSRRPYVRAWFSASEAANAGAFGALLRAENVERLAAAQGGCIVYTHVASGFVRDGRLEPAIERALRHLAELNGWFAPVGSILKHLELQRGLHPITRKEHIALERRWLRDRIAQAVSKRVGAAVSE
jgi:hypothetical protein